MTQSVFFRALTIPVEDKGQQLETMVAHLNGNGAGEHNSIWVIDPDVFKLTEQTPFAYWLSPDLQTKLSAFPSFEPHAGVVRQGLATGNDPQFVRAIWEVRPADLYFRYYPTEGGDFCYFDDPIVRAFYKRRKAGKMKWAFHVKGGSSQPWYSPLTMVVNWEDDGYELKNFRNERGKLRSRPQNLEYYFRPGFSWTLRAVRLVPYIVPANAIPTVSRYIAVPDAGNELTSISYVASNVATGLCRMYGEMFERPKYLVDMLKVLPWSRKLQEQQKQFNKYVAAEVDHRRKVYSYTEPFQEFILPSWVVGKQNTYFYDLTYNPRTLLSKELDLGIAEAYGLGEEELVEIERDMLEAIEFQQDRSAEKEEEEDDDHLVFAFSERNEIEALLQYAVGCAFGRWDVRMAMDPELAPEPAGPFDPMPVCAPGSLVTTNGLPADSGEIVSEEWLRARPNAITLPADDAISSPIIPDSEYPLDVAWNGILADDPAHPFDIVKRVRAILTLLWGDEATEVEAKALEVLGYATLRDYFRDSRRGFFTFHINRYTESRRKAPIYWLLQSENRNYAIWLYYHRLDDTTYFTAARDYADTKVNLETARLDELRQGLAALSGSAQKRRERELERQQKLVSEVTTFRNKLDEIALHQLPPDHNDGVIISIAPLWELVPWKDAEKMWQELVAGKYEWSTMAQQMKARGLVK